MSKYAVVFIVWGERYISEVIQCIRNSPPLQQYDSLLILDPHSKVPKDAEHLFATIVRADFKRVNNKRKTEILEYVPRGYDAYLYLDSDTVVLKDVSLGFEMAEKYTLALTPDAHYSLDHFWDFKEVMDKENLPAKGQLQFNAGVFFFSITPKLEKLFNQWQKLSDQYIDNYKGDQPFLTLAMEQLQFNPYVLSFSYNYRGYGMPISGQIRIWHSHREVPSNINEFKHPWPPRRVVNGQVIYPVDSKSRFITLYLKIHAWIRKKFGQK